MDKPRRKTTADADYYTKAYSKQRVEPKLPVEPELMELHELPPHSIHKWVPVPASEMRLECIRYALQYGLIRMPVYEEALIPSPTAESRFQRPHIHHPSQQFLPGDAPRGQEPYEAEARLLAIVQDHWESQPPLREGETLVHFLYALRCQNKTIRLPAAPPAIPPPGKPPMM